MTENTAQVAHYKGLRAAVLLALKRAQPLAAAELARELGVSVNAIRHHLKELQAESLIQYGREQRGVGAPTLAYRLSPQGEALFPRRYEEALTLMLERLVGKEGRQAAVDLFEEHFRQPMASARAELGVAEDRDRVALVTRLLNDAGYMAEWEQSAGGFRIAEYNCALRSVAERFPEACIAEERFLREVLGRGATIERRLHITQGCNHCEYVVSFADGAKREEH